MPGRDGTGKSLPPRDAATLVVVRSAPGRSGIEVFCVERHQKTGFLNGAIVFPGGKVDASDLDPAWARCTTPSRMTHVPIAADASALRALAVAACREALEEAAILPVAGDALTHVDLLEWRAALARGSETLRTLLELRGLRLDLAALHPLARWVTPAGESTRFDTRFFAFVANGVVTGAHDDYETTASFWAAPEEVLARYDAGELILVPPTHRTLQVLSDARSTADVLTMAEHACLEPICPRIVTHRDGSHETVAVVLPGDPEHEVGTARVPGPSRYVLRNGRFWPEEVKR